MALMMEVFKITGISPLLMNSADKMLEEDGQATKMRTKKINPEEEAKEKLYLTKDGVLCIPSIALRASLWQGSSYIKIGKHAMRSIIDSGVFTVEDECPLVYPGTKDPIKDYEIDKRTVVIQKKSRIVCYRPKIPEWECYLPLEIDGDILNDAELLLEPFNRAGKVAGVLAYRPNCHGPFGRYKVEMVSGVPEKKVKKRGKI